MNLLLGVNEDSVSEAVPRLACSHSFPEVGCLDCDGDFLRVVVGASLPSFLPRVCQSSLSLPSALAP